MGATFEAHLFTNAGILGMVPEYITRRRPSFPAQDSFRAGAWLFTGTYVDRPAHTFQHQLDLQAFGGALTGGREATARLDAPSVPIPPAQHLLERVRRLERSIDPVLCAPTCIWCAF